MKKNRMKSVILAVLLVVVIISLVGCVKLQKKTPSNDTKEDQKDEDKKTDDKKAEKTDDKKADDKNKEDKKMSSIDDEPKKEKKPEKEETPAKETKEKTETAADDGLPVKKVKEGDLVSFPNLQATDPDGDEITYTFTAPLDATGRWQTRVGDAGEHIITITASDGKNEVSQQVKIIVETLNNAPTITLTSPKEITVNEGDQVKIEAQAIDADNDPVTLTFSGWMDSAERTTTFDDAGTHTVTITASDGKTETTEEITVTVNNINRAPIISELADIKVKEGESVKIDAEAEDPDGDEVTITFGAPLDELEGTWEPQVGDAGSYEVDVTATDGERTDTKTFKITVQSLNNPPVIELAAQTIDVEEGETVTIEATITDPENDELTITYTGWMTSSTYQTDYDDAGTHTVTITVTDGINTAEKEVTVNVADKNRPPTFDPSAFN